MNINAEMNYWLAEATNLADLHPQLFDLLDMTRAQGAVTAKMYYNARGFCVHHNTDIWGDSIPVDHVQAGVWALGAAWMSLHLFSHYAFSGDTAFLRESRLSADERDRGVSAGLPGGGAGWNAAERAQPVAGRTSIVCRMEARRVYACRRRWIRRSFARCFDRVSRSSKILGVDAELRAQVDAAAKRLQPFKIGKSGAAAGVE